MDGIEDGSRSGCEVSHEMLVAAGKAAQPPDTIWGEKEPTP